MPIQNTHPTLIRRLAGGRLPYTVMLACAIWTGRWSAASAAEPPKPAPIHWGQESFLIPFFVPPTQDPLREPVEVRLLVSRDQGQTWQAEQRAEPREKQFVFRAPHDGEYWFTIRTVDRDGQQLPKDPPTPSMRVVVDTLKPRLEVTATTAGDGALRVRWQAVDPILKRDTLKIEYHGADGNWIPVATGQADDASPRSTSVGEVTTWVKDALPTDAELRAEIADFAGNRTQVSIRATAGSTTPAVTAANQQSGPNFAGANDLPPQAPALTGPNNNVPNSGGLSSNWSSGNTSGADGPSKAWPADAAGVQPLAQGGSGSSRGEWQSVVKPLQPLLGSGTSSETTARNDLGAPPARSQVFPRVANRAGNDNGESRPEDMLPVGETARMISTKVFDLEYEISAVGPSGVGKVELWQTDDGAKTWHTAGIDEDKKSPFRVKTTGEGIYGFRILVQSASGLSARPPRSGDLPEMWIGVDQTKPTGQIIRTVAGTDEMLGTISIFWQASDRKLAMRPISLFYSSRAGGPWTTIATGLDNTGRYNWQLDNQVPEQVYLRMEVRDEAANVGIYESPAPVSLERTRPEGRLRAVHPSESTASDVRGPTMASDASGATPAPTGFRLPAANIRAPSNPAPASEPPSPPKDYFFLR